MRRVAKIAIPTTAAFGAGAALAVGAIPSSDGTINACYSTVVGSTPQGSLRVVSDPASCNNQEAPLFWNQKGPAGPQGATGAQGANGLNGQNGASGGGGGAGTSAFPGSPAVYILQMDGIKGESNDQKHPGGMQVEDFSWGLTNSAHGAGGGGGAGKVKFHDISVTKPLDTASPKLFQMCATGEHIKKAELFVRKAGGAGADYLHITLTDVLVSSYHVGSQQPKGPGETETISLNFAKYKEEYIPTKPDGSVAGAPIGAGFDVKANKKA